MTKGNKGTNEATDVAIDPQNPNILYASFWGDAIYKSTNAGKTWSPIMNFVDLPSPDFAASATRFQIAISHPSPGGDGTLYTGFDWIDADGYHPARVFKSTDGGASWHILPAGTSPDKVEDYCGGQCWYDNVIEVAPDDPNVVFAAGQFDYGIGSGGIYRSDDGGMTWKNLGWDQHPDFHALAFDPSNSDNVLIGSDGGVWYSTRPRRTAERQRSAQRGHLAEPERVRPPDRASSLRSPPCHRLRAVFWGGTQDNGTLQGFPSKNWYDMTSGDGGQVLVDHTDEGATCPSGFPGPVCFIYGTYYGISPYRIDDGGYYLLNNSSITQGINTNDRSEFYVPFVMNQENTNQLFLGTYRLVSDRQRTSRVGRGRAVEPDQRRPDRWLQRHGAQRRATAPSRPSASVAERLSTRARPTASSTSRPMHRSTATRRGPGSAGASCPNRPVSQIAVDRSNYRIAYVAYSSFNASTPSRPGHVFRTFDGGQTWADVSGNLPDAPVNSIVLDPSYPNTLYAGTDVGPFVTYNGGVDWYELGQGFPIVAINQLDLDPSDRLLAAGTHGRGRVQPHR